MRVIGGSARGRTLRGPKSPRTRPTSDLLRGAIFSMLEARGAEFSRVLDLYAGTGALGIEALSRGAESADFVERDRAMCAVIDANLVLSGLRANARVYCASLPAALNRLAGPYGLIFVDPPYDAAGRADPLAGICDGLVDENSTIVYEHDRRTIPPEACGPLGRIVTRAHGSSAFSLYRAGGHVDDADG